MSAMKRLIGGCVFLCSLLTTTVLAQEVRTQIGAEREPVTAVAPLVTAAATATRVRFVAPGTVVQLRLEVFNESGQKVFDTELRGGNVLDWHLQDGAGDRLPPGAYASVLTIKSLSGRLSQRMGLVTVNHEKASMEAEGGAQLSTAQQQTIGPLEGNAAFTILQNSEAQAITTVTHDGTEGQVARTRGALSFRVGDLFSGKDSEQMRLTEAGRLGIGTSDPQATLDVAGTIRAERVTIVKSANPGSTDKIVSGASAQAVDEHPLASGSGSQNQVAKWTDNAGTLGDSTITELAGKVGIGTTSPDSLLHLAGPSGVNAITLNTPGSQRFRFQTVPGVENWGALTLNANYNAGWFLDNPAINGYFFKLDTRGGNVSGPNNGLWLYRVPAGANPHTDETPIFGVSSEAAFFAGNVGIGTTAPGAKLDVAGDVNTSTQYNIGGSRVVSVAGQDNVFVGVGAGSANQGAFNSFFGKSAGKSNTSGSGNSFFGTEAGLANAIGNSNSFFGISAGGSTFSGSNNTFVGNAAGYFNDSGSNNAFIGVSAGIYNTYGANNVFIGNLAGQSNTSESNNTFIGSLSTGVPGITNAGAIGYRSMVTQSNSLVLGGVSGSNGSFATNVGIGTTAPTNRLSVGGDADFSGNVGIGTTAPMFKLHILDASSAGLRVETSVAGGRVASFASNGDFQIDAPFAPGERFAVREGGNVGIGIAFPNAKLQVVGGDVAITTQSKGLILRAIDGGNCVRLTVNNAGQLGTTFVTCP